MQVKNNSEKSGQRERELEKPKTTQCNKNAIEG